MSQIRRKLPESVHIYQGSERESIDGIAHLFELLAERGQMAFRDLLSAIEDRTGHLLAVMTAYRHVVSLVDAMVPLVRLPNVEGLRVLGRAFLEAKCGLEFIVEVEDQMRRRAIAYQVWHVMSRIQKHEKSDPDTARGQEQKRKWDRWQKSIGSNKPFPGKSSTAAVSNLQAHLAQEPYRSAYEALQKRGVKNWYSINEWFGISASTADFEQLCRYLGYEFLYEAVYRPWSGNVHATSSIENAIAGGRDKSGISSFRSFQGLHESVQLILPIIVGFYQKVFEKLLPAHLARFTIFYRNQYHKNWERFVKNVIFSYKSHYISNDRQPRDSR